MSTPDSTPKPADKVSIAAQAEERFFTLDHVGVVRHLEGVDLQGIMPRVRSIVAAHGGPVEEAVEELRGLPVYTAIAPLGNKMTVWFKVTHFAGVGVVVEAKLFHSTEDSAQADEQLSILMDELQTSAYQGR